jgi:cation transport regulator
MTDRLKYCNEDRDIHLRKRSAQIMPYQTINELPESVRTNLPRHAQEIYLEAFNNAWEQYADPEKRRGSESREETAHKVAWAAVKQKYEKDEKSGKWKEKK